jgi:hypothetical protein
VQQTVQPTSTSQAHLFQQPTSPEWVEVDMRGVRVERSRQLGGCWLGWMLLRQLGLPPLLDQLLPQGREEIGWSVMAQILVLGRLVDSSSELRLAEHTYEASALTELLGVPAEKVNDDRLYRTLDRLLPHKTALEKHLQQRLGELFALDYDLLLYDVTSPYFEGEAAANFLKASRSIKFTSSLGGTPWKLQMSMEPECGGGLPLHLYSATSRR